MTISVNFHGIMGARAHKLAECTYLEFRGINDNDVTLFFPLSEFERLQKVVELLQPSLIAVRREYGVHECANEHEGDF